MVKGKHILITGGRGFIGSALAKILSPDNDVTCYDLGPGVGSQNGVKQITGDILDRELMALAIAASHIVIHTAAMLGVNRILSNAVATLETNYTGTANVLKYAREAGCKHVICLTTSEIFGVDAENVNEHGTAKFPDADDPRWCYGVGKLAAEHLALGYYRQYGLPVTIVRPFNVFGEGRVGSHALLYFITSALKGEDLVVYGNGSQVRAWCYIDDFCDAVLRMMNTREAAIGKSFNIGNPENAISVLGLAEKVIHLCKSKSAVVLKPLPFTDIPVRVPYIGMARSVLGFEPKVGLDEGLERTIEWVREYLEK